MPIAGKGCHVCVYGCLHVAPTTCFPRHSQLIPPAASLTDRQQNNGNRGPTVAGRPRTSNGKWGLMMHSHTLPRVTVWCLGSFQYATFKFLGLVFQYSSLVQLKRKSGSEGK